MSAALPVLIGGLLGSKAVNAVARTITGRGGNKTPPSIVPARQLTTNTARIAAEERDRVAQRIGSRANRRVGFAAGEAASGAKTSILGRAGG